MRQKGSVRKCCSRDRSLVGGTGPRPARAPSAKLALEQKCSRGPVPGRRDRFHQAGLRGSLMSTVPGGEGPVPNVWPTKNSRNLAKVPKNSTSGTGLSTRTGLPAGRSLKQEPVPEREIPSARYGSLRDRSPRAGTGPSLRKCPERADSKDEKLGGYLQNGL
uniref:Uncharacterized protein n=1 Tax=Ananas comosus var. bracteatus TaxID=296719 RepID=A0A6V7PGA3_ANACO|nr:unnamed protein product [Ananas comosus var. bracteatus]